MTRVLIVEDDALSLKLMRDALRAGGFETREIGEGGEALQQAIDFAADLVVMDIGLPGIDGITATRQLKQDRRTSSIPVVAVSAFAMPDDERRMREAGCAAFLTKPIKLRDFVRVVSDPRRLLASGLNERNRKREATTARLPRLHPDAPFM